jgi:P4 family phage/plasmid primase-like protien
MTTSEIADRLKAKKTADGWQACCPAHKDKNASLSISEGNDGKTLVHCHAGCDFDQIAESMGLDKKEFYPEPVRARRQIVAEYSYQDENEKERFQVVRYEPKDFRQRHWDGGDWKWKMAGVDLLLYRLPQVLAKRESKVIFVVEGEKDVHALESLGLTATCNPGGAGKWRAQYTETLTGAMVVIIPDNDSAGEKHRALLCAELYGKAKWVRVLRLTGAKDAAEWIEKGGTKVQLTDALKATPVYSPDDEKQIRADIPDNDDARSVTSPVNGAKGGRPQAPAHADTAEEYVNNCVVKDGKIVLRHWHGSWYSYLQGEGWKQVPDAEVEGRLITYLRNNEHLRTYATSHYSRSVMLNMRAHDLCGLRENVQKPCWLDTGESAKNWVAFKNDVVVNIWKYAEAIANGEEPQNYKRDLTPDFFSSDYVDYEWNPDMHPARFHDYLERVQPDPDNAEAICKMLGILMADTTRYEVFWQLFGKGSNGKTVLLDIIKAMVGKCNLSYVPLANLIQRFGPWPLADSKVNICGELATDVGRGQLYQIEGEFKNAVSGGEIEYEQKNKDKYFATCRSRFIMATNSLPTFVDKSDGIWRRLRVIPFKEQIPDAEKDINLAAKIVASEMPGILAWALDGLAMVIKQGVVTDSKEGEKIKDEHRAGCDHEQQFLAQHYKHGGEMSRVKAKDMYEKYREWMVENGYKPLGAGKFYGRVTDIFPFSEYKTLRFIDGLSKGFADIAEVAIGQAYTEDDDICEG